MKLLYLECSMGIAGDMLNAALYELLKEDQKREYLRVMNSLGLPGVTVAAEPMTKCGIAGTHMTVSVHGEEEESQDVVPDADVLHSAHEHHHHQHHTSMADIERLVGAMPLPDSVKEKALTVYRIIAEAESAVHGRPVEEIHFHEVGSMDAVADVTGAAYLLDVLHPDRIIGSPVHVGAGEVRCAHGILPVPTPATARILADAHIPFYGGSIRGELCTPTGAALLAAFAECRTQSPVMTAEKIGYGCGKKDFDTANVLRAFWGETSDNDTVCELVCNLDDMTPEEIGFATGELMAAGALDVYTESIGMKKNRPGIKLTCMCREEDRERMLRLLFRLTTTLGIREYECRRYKLTRREQAEAQVDGITVHRKSSEGYGTSVSKFEYEDLAALARKRGISLREAEELVRKAAGK